MADSSIRGHLARLLDARLVQPGAGDAYVFRHALTREAVYSTILRHERRAAHQAVAEALEALHAGQLDAHLGDLAYHYFEAGAWEAAGRYARQAGEQAQARHAPLEAQMHYARALEAARQAGRPPAPDLLRLSGQVREVLGDFDGARADLEAALAAARAAGDRREEWQALLDLGSLWASRDYEQAGRCFRAALELARALGDARLLGHSLNRMGNWYLNHDDIEAALAHHLEALALFEPAADARGLAETHDLLGLTYGNQGDLDRSRDHYERALPLFRALDDRRGEASALQILADAGPMLATDTAVPALTLDEARALAEAALRLAQAIGWRAGEAYSRLVIGNAWLTSGDFGRAAREIELGAALASEIGHHQWQTLAAITRGLLLAEQLELEAARQQLEAARGLALRINSNLWVRFSSGLLVPVLLELGDLDGAEAVLREGLRPEDTPRSAAERLAACGWAGLWLARGEADRARALLERLAALTPNVGPGRAAPRVWALWGRACAAQGQWAAAARLFQENLHANPGMGALGWRLQAELARALWALGRAAEAQQAADEARVGLFALAATLPSEAERTAFTRAALRRIPSPA